VPFSAQIEGFRQGLILENPAHNYRRVAGEEVVEMWESTF
jgi:hypothetical protein